MIASKALLLCAALCLAPLAQGAESCRFKWDASREVAVHAQQPVVVTAGRVLADAATIEAEKLYGITLQPQETVTLASPPSKKMLSDGAYAGLLRFRVLESGTYRVAIDSGYWLDLVSKGSNIASSDFNGSQDCPGGPRKIVVFELTADSDVVIQASAASRADVRLSVTRVPASRP